MHRQYIDHQEGVASATMVTRGARTPVVESVLSLEDVLFIILGHFEPSDKKILRGVSKAFKQIVDKTIRRFKGTDWCPDRDMTAFLAVPWDFHVVEYSQFDYEDNNRPPQADTHLLISKLDSWKNLKELRLNSVSPDVVGLLGSCKLSALTSLFIDLWDLDAVSVEKLCKATWWQQIRRLKVEAPSEFNHPGVHQMYKRLSREIAPLLVNLEELDLENDYSSSGAALFNITSGFPKLRRLDCYQLNEDMLIGLSRLMLPKLETIRMNVECLEAEATKMISNFDWPSLKRLELYGEDRHCHIKFIVEATWANNLTRLDLSAMFGNVSLQGIDQCEWHSLEELTLCPWYHKGGIGEDGLPLLKRARFPSLTKLVLKADPESWYEWPDENIYTPFDLSALIGAPWLSQLRSLDVYIFSSQLKNFVELVKCGSFKSLVEFRGRVTDVDCPVPKHVIRRLALAGQGKFLSMRHFDFTFDYYTDGGYAGCYSDERIGRAWKGEYTINEGDFLSEDED